MDHTPAPPNPPNGPQATSASVDAAVRSGSGRGGGGLLRGMRVRKKVFVLHTLFSLGLAAMLLVPLRPAITEVVEQAEVNEARAVLGVLLAGAGERGAGPSDAVLGGLKPDAALSIGTAEELGLGPALTSQAMSNPGRPVTAVVGGGARALAFVPDDAGGKFWAVSVRIPEARSAVARLYILTAAALLAVYALVAAALELFVLPQHVYGPIDRMLGADRAIQEGDKEREIIPERDIPADELGEIMRSRNQSIQALRRHERALAEALAELERVASDLKRKNHLLEAAQRNLADADRLASLGMMSAGIAHELNTPLAVLKGLVERLHGSPERRLEAAEAALMLRVVRRLERLGDSLLDFARVRPPSAAPVSLRTVVDEAATLVRLDRDARDVDFINRIPESLIVECDGDRMVQVLVNLLRNATDAIRAARAAGNSARPAAEQSGGERPPGRIEIQSDVFERDAREWVSLTITDNGPGIDPDLLSRLFEPFASTRLDAHGTGLGLAVAEGIVREHGGLILARNRADRGGAVFEVMLPTRAMLYPVDEGESAAGAPSRPGSLFDEPAPAGPAAGNV